MMSADSWLRLLIVIAVGSTTVIGGYCPCSYGGFCFKDPPSGTPLLPCPSESCPVISQGFYAPDCETIENHCFMSPCKRGKCVPTFGSYFCRCPKGYVGKNCENYRPDLAVLGVNTDVYVYYQVQSGPRGEKIDFHLIYDPGKQENINSLSGTGVQVKIQLDDGRSMYPTTENEFTLMDVKQKCLTEAKLHTEWQDVQVCGLIPSGKVLTYAFNSKFERVDLSDMPGSARFAYIEIVYVNNGKQGLRLFNERYRIYTYFTNNVPNDCLMMIGFHGCSSHPLLVIKRLRKRRLFVTPIANQDFRTCVGSKRYSTSWYLQRNSLADARAYDSQAHHLEEYEGAETLILRSNYLPEGVHMIEYRLVLQGEPPHYGSLATFEIRGRCWIDIELGPMRMKVLGGRHFTASCFQPVTMKLFTQNRGYKFSEMSFVFSCNHEDDPECKETQTDVPSINKYHTPCDTKYVYTITSSHYGAKVTTETFHAIIDFVPTDIRMSLECLFNCYPIDPTLRMVMFARTNPYAPARVEWTITANGSVVLEREPEVDAFFPFSASRIIRVDGSLFITNKQETTNEVEIKASSHMLGLIVSTETVVINLEVLVNSFHLVETSNREYMFYTQEEVTALNLPLTFKVLQTSHELQDSVVLLQTTLLEELFFFPEWKRVQLCIFDATLTEACSREFAIKHPSYRVIHDWHIKNIFESGDTNEFLNTVAFWMYNKIYSAPPYTFGWRVKPFVRRRMLKDLLKTKDWNQRNVLTITHILAMNFYSEKGNRNERLVEFTDDLHGFRGYADFLSWIEAKIEALNVLQRICDWSFDYSFTQSPKLIDLLYGDLVDGLFRCWSLAHVQGTISDEWILNNFEEDSYRDWLLGSVELIHQQMDTKLAKILFSYARAMARYTRTFYGIRNVGDPKKQKYARAWTMKSTYTGIRQGFNKSKVGETLWGYSDYIFGPVFPGEEWVQYASIEMPDKNLLSGKELCMSVILVSNRPDDFSVSPLLYMQMSNTEGDVIHHLPGFAMYNVTLPVMLEGRRVSKQPGRDIFGVIARYSNHENEEDNMLIYKVVLPSVFKTWNLALQMSERVPLKVLISHDRIPVYEEVNQLEAVEGKWDDNVGAYYTEVAAEPEIGEEQLPLYFYVGMLLSESFTNDTPVNFIISSGVNLCEIVDPLARKPRKYCKGLEKRRKGELRYIDCVCNEFGFITGVAKISRVTQIIMKDINFEVPVRFTFQQHIMTFASVTLTLVVVVIAIIRDLVRRKRSNLKNVEDTYPLDKVPLLIGVFTGMEFMSGTKASIAIKVTGLSSSSRVHLLKSNWKTELKTATDEWFMMMTNQPLGKITSVTLWSNYHNLSSWYCRRIMIFDLKQGTWYMALVDKWFRLNPFDKVIQLGHFKTIRLSPVDTKLKALPDKFKEHVITEVRNSHHLASLFCLHDRSLYNHEQRSLIIVLKTFAIFFLTWVLPEIVYPAIFEIPEGQSGGLHPETGLGVDEHLLATSLIIVGCSYILLSPFYLLVKSTTLSHVVQRKVTNPLYQETVPATPQYDIQKGFSIRPSHGLEAVHSITSITKADTSRNVAFRIDSTTSSVRSESSWQLGGDRPSQAAFKVRKPRGKQQLQPWWRNFYKFAFGPCQFRCVNVSRRNLRLKMHKRMLATRLTSFLVLGLCFYGIFFFEEHTNYWGKYSIHLFISVFSLAIDVLIVNPLLILFNSTVLCFILKTTNRELFLWNEDTRVGTPEPMTFTRYLKIALKSAYKPQTTAKLELLNEWTKLLRLFELLVFIFALILMMLLTGSLLQDKHESDYHYTISSLNAEYGKGYNYVTQTYISIKEVLYPAKLLPYLTSTFLSLEDSWPGGQRISGRKERWCRDRIGKPVGGTSLYFTFLSTEKTLHLLDEFQPYFPNPIGYLSEGEIQTEPVVLAREALNYTDDGIELVVSGESSAPYKFQGQHIIVPSSNWQDYYVQIATIILELINRNSTTDTLRAFIFSSNFFNGFASRINTIDLVVEFLPSGLLAARTHVFSLKSSSAVNIAGNLQRVSLMILIAGFFIYALLQHSRLGLRAYVSELSGVVQLGLVASGITVWIGFFSCHLQKSPIIDEVFNAPAEKYVDLHQTHYWDVWDSIYLALFFFLACIEIGALIFNKLGSEAWSRGIRSATAIATSVWFLTILYVRVAEMCSHSVHDRPRFFLYANYYFRTIMPIPRDFVVFPTFIFIAIIIGFISSRFCTALFVYQFEREFESFQFKKLNKLFIFLKMLFHRKAKKKTEDENLELGKFNARLLKRPSIQRHSVYRASRSVSERKLSIRSAKLNSRFQYLQGLWK